MDSPDVAETSDAEEQETLWAESNPLEYFEAAASRIRRGMESYKAIIGSLHHMRSNERRSEHLAKGTESERQSPPRKRIKVSRKDEQFDTRSHASDKRVVTDAANSMEMSPLPRTRLGGKNAWNTRHLASITAPAPLFYALTPTRKASRLASRPVSPAFTRETSSIQPPVNASVPASGIVVNHLYPLLSSALHPVGESFPTSRLPTPETPYDQTSTIPQSWDGSSSQAAMERMRPVERTQQVAPGSGAQPRSPDFFITHHDTLAGTHSRGRSPDPLLLFTPKTQDISAVDKTPKTHKSVSSLASSSRMSLLVESGRIPSPEDPEVDADPPKTPTSPLTPLHSPIASQLLFLNPSPTAENQIFPEGRRYALRRREARQLNPYLYDKKLYRQQLRSNPDAIVSVLSPARRRRGSPRPRDDSSSEAEAEIAQENDDREEERFWRRHEKRKAVNVDERNRETRKSGIGGPEAGRGRSDSVLTRLEGRPPSDDSWPAFFYDTFSDDDDLLPLAQLPRHNDPVQQEKPHKKRLKRFPMKTKDLLGLKTGCGDELPSDPFEHVNSAAPGSSILPNFRQRSEARSADGRPRRNSSVISLSSGQSVSRAPSPAPQGPVDRDMGICSQPLPPVDIPSEQDIPPTSSFSRRSRSGSARRSHHSEDNEQSLEEEHGSSSGSSKLDDVTEAERRRRKEDRRREKALRRMMPAAMARKLLTKGATQTGRAYRSEDNDSEEGDKPLLPGQTRVRKGLHRTVSEIRGDPESSDAEIAEDSSVRGVSPPFLVADADSDVEGRVDHHRQTYKRSITVISLISSSDTDSSNESEDIEEVVGRWVSTPAEQQSTDRADDIREGDLINRMLSRTRVSNPKKKKPKSSSGQRSSRGRGGGGGGGRVNRVTVVTHGGARNERQSRLPFKRQQSSSSRASGSTFIGLPENDVQDDFTIEHLDPRLDEDPPALLEFQIEDGYKGHRTLKPKEKRKLVKGHGLYTFTPSGAQIVAGRHHPTAVSTEAEHEVVQRSILEFAHRDDRRVVRPSDSMPKKRQVLEGKHVSSNTPDAAMDLPQPAEVGKFTLPSGLLFGRSTYLGSGWLQDLLAMHGKQDSYEITRPNATTAYDFFIPSAPSMDAFVELLNQVYDEAFRIVRADSPRLIAQALQDWRRLLRCICQHISWFLANSDPEGLAPLSLSLSHQLRRASSLVDEGYAVRADTSAANLLVFEIQWFSVELAFRSQRFTSISGDYSRPWHHIPRLLKHLWAYGLNRPRTAIGERSPEGFDYANPSLRIAEIWICLIHLVQHDNAFDTIQTASFWKTLLDVVKDPATNGGFSIDLHASELVWVGIFGLVSLSQFNDRGVSLPTPRLPACWELVMDALGRIRLDATGDHQLSSRALKKRDRYIRLLFTRCMVLRKTWNWHLTDGQLVIQLFRRLHSIFGERQFANLPSETSDFPSFLRNNDLQLLSQTTPKDTAFTLLLKLIVQIAQDANVNRIIAIAVPVGSVTFTKDKPPTKAELSKLYNRFSAVAVAIHLFPSQENVIKQLSTARRYVKYDKADWETRRACIRGLQHLAILLRDLQLPLEDLLAWLAEMATVLISEYTQLSKSQPGGIISLRDKKWCIVTIQLLLGCVDRIIKTDISRPGRAARPPQYPDPALLQGPWVSEVFATKNLIAVPTTGESMRVLIQAFLDARRAVLPPPEPLRPVEMEDDSQEDYAMDDVFFDDPEVRAAMGEAQVDNVVSWQEKEAVFCKFMENQINSIFRLLCSKLDPPTILTSVESWRSTCDEWVEFWVGCAAVLVHNKKRDWSSFLGMGLLSLDRARVSDQSRRQYISLRFLFTLLGHEPAAYAPTAVQDTFLRMLMQSLATPKLSFEHDFVALVFSTDGLQHPLLRDLPFCERQGVQVGFVISKEHFLAHRVAWVQHLCGRIMSNLIVASWDIKLGHQCEMWIGWLQSMLSTMQGTHEQLAAGSEERVGYRQFCGHIREILIEYPALQDHKHLKTYVNWLDTLG